MSKQIELFDDDDDESEEERIKRMKEEGERLKQEGKQRAADANPSVLA